MRTTMNSISNPCEKECSRFPYQYHFHCNLHSSVACLHMCWQAYRMQRERDDQDDRGTRTQPVEPCRRRGAWGNERLGNSDSRVTVSAVGGRGPRVLKCVHTHCETSGRVKVLLAGVAHRVGREHCIRSIAAAIRMRSAVSRRTGG